MAANDMPLGELLTYLQTLANQSLHLWDMPQGAEARLINVSENATYLVEAPGGYKAVLRVHRDGYHSRRAIECELAWLDALGRAGAVTTSGYHTGRDGSPIQEARITGLPGTRFLVLFHFVEGSKPDESRDLTPSYEQLGQIAAKCHLHALSWDKPSPFERLVWDVDTVFGDQPTWGDWRDAPEVDNAVRGVLEEVESTIRQRLCVYGKSTERYNLIHADMRLANLLVNDADTRLIDFDDCGHGWLMYDFATTISFIEDDPRIPQFKAAWLRGYRSLRPVSPQDEAEMDTFIMLRRMALLAWIGSHSEAPEPQELAPGFAATTARLGQAWMASLDSQS
ncbi:MAG: phosphotransferase [Pseudomonadota bacterium]